MEPTTEFTRETMDALGAPFPDDEVEFLPRASSGGMALGLPYIDARSVMRRLDATVGPGNWSFDFDLLAPDGKMVKGRLTVCGVTKCDAGEANQEDEALKSAVSDALKRCAVHFGIGRYLYYLPKIWAPYDAQKRRFIEPPRLDPSAVRRALEICGVSAKDVAPTAPPRRPAPVSDPSTNGSAARSEQRPQPERPQPEAARPSAPAHEAPRRPAAAAGPSASAGPAGAATQGGRSIWSVGANGVRENGPAPESAGDRAVTRPAADRVAESAVAPGAPSAAAAPAALVCSTEECGKPLTKGQHDVSMRAFGQPLCPACQKLHRPDGLRSAA